MTLVWLRNFRYFILVSASALSLVVLALNIESGFKILQSPYRFHVFNVVLSVITLATLPVMLGLTFILGGAAFTSRIIFELSSLSLLFILWLAAAIVTTSSTACGATHGDAVKLGCGDAQVIAAFAFAICFILSSYTLIIFSLSVAAHRKGSNIWNSSISGVNFSNPTSIPDLLTEPSEEKVISTSMRAVSVEISRDPFMRMPPLQEKQTWTVLQDRAVLTICEPPPAYSAGKEVLYATISGGTVSASCDKVWGLHGVVEVFRSNHTPYEVSVV